MDTIKIMKKTGKSFGKLMVLLLFMIMETDYVWISIILILMMLIVHYISIQLQNYLTILLKKNIA